MWYQSKNRVQKVRPPSMPLKSAGNSGQYLRNLHWLAPEHVV